MPVIYGNYEGDEKAAEIFLSAKPSQWISLSEKIISEKSDFTLVLREKLCQCYSQTLKKLKFRESAHDILNIDIVGDDLMLFGNSKTRNNFAESLAECFTTPVPDGFHLHYDYFPDGGGLLGPTGHSLVIGRSD